MTINLVLLKTDWELLRTQKKALLETIETTPDQKRDLLQGLLHWIDAIQDAAHSEGYRVEFDHDRSA